MKHPSLILGLATAGNAIDTLIHRDWRCQGSWVGCINLNPNVCCYTDASNWGKAGLFNAIPTFWYVEIRMYDNLNCDPNRQFTEKWFEEKLESDCVYDLQGGVNVGSMGYGFLSGRPSRHRRAPEDTEGCTSRQRADVLGLADGTRYNISTLDEGQRAELMGHAEEIVQKRDVPRHFDEFLM